MTEQKVRSLAQAVRDGFPGSSMLTRVGAAARRGRREAIVAVAPGRVARFIARNRSRRPLKLAAVASQAYLSAFENEDWDMSHNGEARLLSAALGLWPECFVALDVGSFAGEWAQIALRDNQHAQIHCFEIVEHLSEKLCATFSGNSQVVVNRSGLWSSDTELSGYFSPRFPSMSSLVPAVRTYTGNPGHEFRTTVETGDSYCARHGIDQINFMKIDVEGAELEVLRGFVDCFRRRRVDMVQFEYGPLTLAAGFRLEQYMEFLMSNDMRVGKIYPTHVGMVDRYYPGLDDFRWANFVAMRPEVAANISNALSLRPRF